MTSGQSNLNTKVGGFNPMQAQALPNGNLGQYQTYLNQFLNNQQGQSMPGMPSVPGQINSATGLPTQTNASGLNSYLPSLYANASNGLAQPGLNMQPAQQQILDMLSGKTQDPMIGAMQNQLKRKHDQEIQDLMQSQNVRGLSNSTMGNQERANLQAQQDDELTMMMGQLYNQILPTQVNAVQSLQNQNLAQQGFDVSTLLNTIGQQEALQQGQFGRESAARQLGGQEQQQLFGQGMQTRQQGVGELMNALQGIQGIQGQEFQQGTTQRQLSLDELLKQTGAQAALEGQGFQQGTTANQMGFQQDQQTRTLQQAMLESMQNQNSQQRSQSLAEFLSLLNAQMGLDTNQFNQSNQSIGLMLNAMGMNATPQNVPGYQVPIPGTGAAGAVGNIFGNALSSYYMGGGGN